MVCSTSPPTCESDIFGLENSRCQIKVKFDNEVVTCTYDDEVGTDDLIDDNVDTLDLKGKWNETRSTLEAKIRSDLTLSVTGRDEKVWSGIPNLTHWKRRSPTVHLGGQVGGRRMSTLGSV